jgi:hypothetical protein
MHHKKSYLVAALLPFLILAFTKRLAAQETRDEFTERVTADLRARNPEAADLFVRANEARDRADLVNAEVLFRQVLELAPEFDHAVRRLCGIVLQRGHRNEALVLCRQAMELAETRENRGALIDALLTGYGGEPPPAADLQEALLHARTLLGDPEAGLYDLISTCMAADANDELDVLRQCSQRLESVAPHEGATHYYAWLVAMSDGDFSAAEQRLELARADGMAPELYRDLAQRTAAAKPDRSALVPIASIVGGFILLALILYWFLGRRRGDL